MEHKHEKGLNTLTTAAVGASPLQAPAVAVEVVTHVLAPQPVTYSLVHGVRSGVDSIGLLVSVSSSSSEEGQQSAAVFNRYCLFLRKSCSSSVHT